jgi:hypothetical protein
MQHLLDISNLAVLWSSVAAWLSQPNLGIILGELQVYDMKFETVKYEHSLPAKVSSGQPFPVAGRFRQPVSSGLKSFPLATREPIWM